MYATRNKGGGGSRFERVGCVVVMYEKIFFNFLKPLFFKTILGGAFITIGWIEFILHYRSQLLAYIPSVMALNKVVHF